MPASKAHTTAGEADGDERGEGDRFARAVLAIVESIPSGSVLSYGEIAALLGSRAARAVGTVMARSGSTTCWWRVVRSSGHPPRGLEEQALEHYRAEGTPLTAIAGVQGYRVDYPKARWNDTF